MKKIKYLWSKIWGRRASISVQFDGLDASMDKCLACGRARKFHKRSTDHRFREDK